MQSGFDAYLSSRAELVAPEYCEFHHQHFLPEYNNPEFSLSLLLIPGYAIQRIQYTDCVRPSADHRVYNVGKNRHKSQLHRAKILVMENNKK